MTEPTETPAPADATTPDPADVSAFAAGEDDNPPGLAVDTEAPGTETP